MLLKFDAQGKPTIDLGGTLLYILQIWHFLETQSTITRCDLLAMILFKLVDSYLTAFKFEKKSSIDTKESGR